VLSQFEFEFSFATSLYRHKAREQLANNVKTRDTLDTQRRVLLTFEGQASHKGRLRFPGEAAATVQHHHQRIRDHQAPPKGGAGSVFVED